MIIVRIVVILKFLIVLLFIIFNLFNCTPPQKESTYDDFSFIILHYPTFRVGKAAVEKENSYLVPDSVISPSKYRYGIVVCVRHSKERVMLQQVEVKLIEKVDSHVWVTNLEENDIILLSPKKVISELRKINLKELGKRFLHPRLINENVELMPQ